MKKILFFTSLILGLSLTSCNNEPSFPGLDEISKIPNVKKYSVAYGGAAFTADKPANTVLPEWLKAKYYTVDKGSTAMVDYKFAPSIPEYITEVSATGIYTLASADYQEAWGEESPINYFSPSKPARNFLPTILGQAIEEPADDALLAVNYNQADRDGTLPAFTDDFEGGLTKWVNIATVGNYNWQIKTFSNNNYAQQSAYNHKAGALESYLITAEPVTIKTGLVLAFDALYCNYREAGGRVAVLISTDLQGFETDQINAATWKDITDNFEFVISPNNSGDITPVEDYSLDEFAGKKIYLAFKYEGDTEGDKTTTVRLDNIAIKEATQVPVEYKEVRALYKYNGSAWVAYSEVEVLQPADYAAIGEDYFTATAAQTYIPAYLSLKYPYALPGTVKAVAFKNNAAEYMAVEYQKTASGWTTTTDVIELTDEYEYDGSNWVYVRTVPKAALNEDFDGRKVTQNEATMLEDWLNIAVVGDSYWVDKTYNNNNYTQCSAYAAVAGAVDAWFVTPVLEIKNNYILTFDMASGFWTHEALQVYVSSSFSGKEDDLDPEATGWTDITASFDYPKNETGYSSFTNVGKYDLSGYAGQKVYVAFRYLGDKDKNYTSTVQLDNIYVGE